ncbi:MAG: type II toxin-antitoxin system RelE/ParE family toxin [Chloroflexi bacterium]|nr:type II toxin-antitoxin system RelE/ParE family toxin [Chloroflexota bacterium]
MNLYRLDITPNAKRQLKSVFPERKRAEIVEAILDLREEPMPSQSELQRELTGRFRLKIDGWRILYKIDKIDRVVTVLAIRPRNPSTYLNVP